MVLLERRYLPLINCCRCILAEMFYGEPVFRAHSEITQLEKISVVCGTPTPAVWPNVVNLPLYSTLRPKKVYKRRVREEFNL